MTLIDSLLIELKLDGSNVGKNATAIIGQLRKVEQTSNKAAAETEEGWSKAGDAFAKVRREALGAFAVFTAGRSLKAFTSDITEANAQLGYLSTRLNIAPARLYQMQQATAAAGGSAAEVGASFAAVQQKMLDPRQMMQMSQDFSRLGVGNFIDQHTGAMRTDIIERLNAAVHQSHMNPAMVQALMSDIGFGQGQINQALMDPARLRALDDTFKNLGPTPEQIRASQQLLQDWKALQAQTESIGRSILGDFTPSLDQVVVSVTAWEKENPQLAKTIAEVAAAVGILGAAITGLMGLSAVRGLLSLPAAIGAAQKAAGVASAAAGAAGGASAAGASGPKNAAIRQGRMLKYMEAGRDASGLSLGDAAWLTLRRAGYVGIAYEALHSTSANENETATVQRLMRAHRIGRSGSTHSTFDAYERTQREGRALSILTGMGYSRNAALGIIGNIGQESGFDEKAIGDNGSAVGLAQWHAPRVADIRKRFGIDVMRAGFDDQVRAIGLEAQQMGLKTGLNAAKDSEATSTIIRQFYERPANRDGGEDARRFALTQQASRDLAGNTTHVALNGDIVINTSSNNPKQMAADFKTELRRQIPAQAASGLQ